MLKTIEKRKKKDVQSNVEIAGGEREEMAAAEMLDVRSWRDVVGEIVDVKDGEEGRRRSERKPGLRKSVVSCPPLGLISNSKS